MASDNDNVPQFVILPATGKVDTSVTDHNGFAYLRNYAPASAARPAGYRKPTFGKARRADDADAERQGQAVSAHQKATSDMRRVVASAAGIETVAQYRGAIKVKS